MTLKEIEDLALKVAKEAIADSNDLSLKIDALRALSPYYAALKKAEARGLGDETGTLDDMIAEIEETNGARHKSIQDH